MTSPEIPAVNVGDLQTFAAQLADLRDAHRELFLEHGDRGDDGRSVAYAQAIALLHIATTGAVGEPL